MIIEGKNLNSIATASASVVTGRFVCISPTNGQVSHDFASGYPAAGVALNAAEAGADVMYARFGTIDFQCNSAGEDIYIDYDGNLVADGDRVPAQTYIKIGKSFSSTAFDLQLTDTTKFAPLADITYATGGTEEYLVLNGLVGLCKNFTVSNNTVLYVRAGNPNDWAILDVRNTFTVEAGSYVYFIRTALMCNDLAIEGTITSYGSSYSGRPDATIGGHGGGNSSWDGYNGDSGSLTPPPLAESWPEYGMKLRGISGCGGGGWGAISPTAVVPGKNGGNTWNSLPGAGGAGCRIFVNAVTIFTFSNPGNSGVYTSSGYLASAISHGDYSMITTSLTGMFSGAGIALTLTNIPNPTGNNIAHDPWGTSTYSSVPGLLGTGTHGTPQLHNISGGKGGGDVLSYPDGDSRRWCGGDGSPGIPGVGFGGANLLLVVKNTITGSGIILTDTGSQGGAGAYGGNGDPLSYGTVVSPDAQSGQNGSLHIYSNYTALTFPATITIDVARNPYLTNTPGNINYNGLGVLTSALEEILYITDGVNPAKGRVSL